MVLKSIWPKGLLLFFTISLNACSFLDFQTQTNRSDAPAIIPATTQNTVPVESSKQTTQVDSQPSPSADESLPETSSQNTPGDVLSSILNSAKKAIQNQQWLRAQHHIEHGLRVAPKDAEVYYLYGLVYEGLGVQKQAINMLKRARFLAHPNSEIYHLADIKLASLIE